MQRISSWICWAISSSLLAADPNPLTILRPGLFHGDEVQVRNGSQWMALSPVTARTLAWKPVRVWARPAPDPVVGDNSAVKVAISGEALLLFKDRQPWMTNKTVTATFYEPDGKDLVEPVRLASGEQLSIDSQWRLLFNDQTLYQWTQAPEHDEHKRILFAGDLDGDGRTDLIMDLSEHANVTHIRVYLSSKRGPQQPLVGLAAEFRTLGC